MTNNPTSTNIDALFDDYDERGQHPQNNRNGGKATSRTSLQRTPHVVEGTRTSAADEVITINRTPRSNARTSTSSVNRHDATGGTAHNNPAPPSLSHQEPTVELNINNIIDDAIPTTPANDFTSVFDVDDDNNPPAPPARQQEVQRVERGEQGTSDDYDNGNSDWGEHSNRRPHTRALTKNDVDTSVDAPEWVVSMKNKLLSSVSHAFLLEGNIRDYMVRNITIRDGLVSVFDSDYSFFEIIACYDQSRGMYFYGDDETSLDGRTMSEVYRERFERTYKRLTHSAMNVDVESLLAGKNLVLLFESIAEMFNMPGEGGYQSKIMLIIDYAEMLVPDASSAQMKPDERKLCITLSEIGRSQLADEYSNCLFFLVDDPTQLSSRLRATSSRIETIKIPNPLLEQRRDFINHVLDIDDNRLTDGTQIFEDPESITAEELATSTAGLSCIQIEDIVLRALADDVPLHRQLVKERKNEIIQVDYEGLLEIVDPSFGFDQIGGSEDIKRMFMDEVIEPIRAGDTAAVPMGVLLMGSPGGGKAHSDETLIFAVQNGCITTIKIKDLQVGDTIYGRNGRPTKVLGVYPQGELDEYRVTLMDGRSICCSEDHLWTVYQVQWDKPKENKTNIWRPLTTIELIDRGIKEPNSDGTHPNRCRWFLPMNKALEFPEKDLPVDPYVVGAFIGDGCCTEPSLGISSSDEFIPNEIARILGAKSAEKEKHEYTWKFCSNDEQLVEMNKRGYPLRYSNNGRKPSLQSKDVLEQLPELHGKLAHEKSIPAMYKTGSVQQRYDLIQGLFDTDGTIRNSDRYHVQFFSSSYALVKDVQEVFASLGISSTIKKVADVGEPCGNKKYPDREYTTKHPEYSLHVNCPNELKPNLFRLPRKKERAFEAAKHPKKHHYDRIGIASIEPTGRRVPMTCIRVDAPDSLFVAGTDCIVTHNTMISKGVAKEAGFNFVALNLNRIMDKWVGSSERNLDRALDCALAMAPTIIFIDEIDEALPNRNDPNQSSVNKRINQRLLTFFSDTSHRGEVVILAATNYPDKLDPAFKRAGRFDLRLPMFAPDEWDRMRIMLVIAKSRGYSFSWFEHPDTVMENPFKRLKGWVARGNVPVNERFVGELKEYTYNVLDSEGKPMTDASTGKPIQKAVYLPGVMIDALDREEIPLWQFYRLCNIMFEEFSEREVSTSSAVAETDESFYKRFHDYIHQPSVMDFISNSPSDLMAVEKRFRQYDKIYGPFARYTFSKTGAELDVVMNKAITLWRRWCRENPEKLKVAIETRRVRDERDIPYHILELACHKTVSAVVGIKEMEDAALVNTSDRDYIPDAVYGKNDEGKEISYLERQEVLLTRKTTLI